jgi:hypothetical protein
MREFDTALVLSRVLTSGIVMSIERNDRELPGLERLLAQRFGRARVSLVNSRTAAVHAALTGLGIGHGDRVVLPDPPDWQRAFLAWLGVEPVPAATNPAATNPAATDPAATDPAATDPAATDRAETGAAGTNAAGTSAAGGGAAFGYAEIGPQWLAGPAPVGGDVPVLVLDLTPLGFGPAGAVLTDEEAVWARAERLKIFGAFDLRTMWTQEESRPDLVPGVQFNYRLSPLVAACIRTVLAGAGTGRRRAAAAGTPAAADPRAEAPEDAGAPGNSGARKVA